VRSACRTRRPSGLGVDNNAISISASRRQETYRSTRDVGAMANGFFVRASVRFSGLSEAGATKTIPPRARDSVRYPRAPVGIFRYGPAHLRDEVDFTPCENSVSDSFVQPGSAAVFKRQTPRYSVRRHARAHLAPLRRRKHLAKISRSWIESRKSRE